MAIVDMETDPLESGAHHHRLPPRPDEEIVRAPPNTLKKGSSIGSRILKALSPDLSPKSPPTQGQGILSPLLLPSAQRASISSVRPYIDRWFTFLQKHFVDATCGLMTAQLDRMVRQAVDSLSTSETSRKHFSRPFLMLLHSRRYTLAMLLICAVYTFLLSSLGMVLLSSRVEGDTFVFEPIEEHRRAGAAGASWNISSVGVMHDECVLHASREERTGNAITLLFPRKISVNGWYFTAEAQSEQAADSLRFRMTVLGPDGERAVGQPDWWTCRKRPAEWAVAGLTNDGEPREFHFAPPAAWVSGCLLEFAILAVGSFVAGVLARGRQLRKSWNVVSVVLWLLLGTSWLFGVLLTAQGEWRLGFRWWNNVLVSAALLPCVTLSTAEMLLIPTLCTAGLLYEILLVVDFVFVRQCGESIFKTHELYLGMFMVALGGRLELRRRRAMAEIRQQLREDTEKMELAWQQVSREITTEDQIQFFNCIAAASEDVARTRPHHTQVLDVSSMKLDVLAGLAGAPGGSGEDGGVSERRSVVVEPPPSPPFRDGEVRAMVHPLKAQLEQQLLEQQLHGSLLSGGKPQRVQSLDQLYAQAAAMRLILQDKVKSLASASGALLPTTAERKTDSDPERVLVKWADIEGDAQAEAEVHWSTLKPTIRAVEKAVYEYKGDVSMVVDICRETLVFRHLKELTSCLQVMVDDADITIVRLKNSIGPGQDTELCAGFRSVHLNIHITSEDAAALGLQGHICEVLLVLAPFALAQTVESHERFLQLRDMRESSPLDELILRVRRLWRQWLGVRPPTATGADMEWEMGRGRTGGSTTNTSDVNGSPMRNMVRSLGNSFKGSFKTRATSTGDRCDDKDCSCHQGKRGSGCSRSALLTSAGGTGSPERSITSSPTGTARGVRTGVPRIRNWRRGGASEGLSRDVSGLESMAGSSEGEGSGVRSPKGGRRGSWHCGGGRKGGSALGSHSNGGSALGSRRSSGCRGSRRSSFVEQVLGGGVVARLEGMVGMRKEEVEGESAQALLALEEKRGSATSCSEEGALSIDTEICEVPQPAPQSHAEMEVQSARASKSLLRLRQPLEEDLASPSSSFNAREARAEEGVATVKVMPVHDEMEWARDEAARRRSSRPSVDMSRLVSRRNNSFFLGWGQKRGSLNDSSQRSPPCCPLTPVSATGLDGLWVGGVEESVANAWRGLLRTQFLISATQPADRLDQQRRDTARAYANAGDIAVLNSPFPVAAALCKRWFCILATVAGLLCLALFSLHLASNLRVGDNTAHACIRFRPLELRGRLSPRKVGRRKDEGDHGLPGRDVGWESVVGSFGILQAGCAVTLSGGVWNKEEGALEFRWAGEHGEGFDFDGFYFETNEGGSELDPLVFVLETQPECRGDWQVVGASRRYITVENEVVWLEEGFRTPLERGAMVAIDLRLPWYSWLGRLQQKGVYGVALLGMAWCGFNKRPERGVQVMVAGLWVVLWPWGIVAWGEISDQHFVSGQLPVQWIHPLCHALVVAGVSWKEGWVPWLAVFAGVQSTVFSIVERTVFLKGTSGGEMLHSDPRYDISAYTCLVVGLLLVVIRRRATAQAKAMIHADILEYRRAWERVDPQGALEVQEAARSMVVHRSSGRTRQQFFSRRFTQQFESEDLYDSAGTGDPPQSLLSLAVSRQPSARSDRSMHKSWSGRTVSSSRSDTFRSTSSRRMLDLASSILSNKVADESAQRTVPVGSLDQLYVQAAGMHPVLLHKVQEWAAASEGRFRMEGAAETFMLWREVKDDVDLRRLVRFAGLKHHSRASEKVARVYGGKVWLLCDVCRQSVYFDSAAALAACLRTIAEDQQAVVSAVKNRLTAEYDDQKTAGYRDVNLNLRIVTDDTVRFGLHNHICEVQLILTSFAELKTDAGHKRYVAYRNARAE